MFCLFPCSTNCVSLSYAYPSVLLVDGGHGGKSDVMRDEETFEASQQIRMQLVYIYIYIYMACQFRLGSLLLDMAVLCYIEHVG